MKKNYFSLLKLKKTEVYYVPELKNNLKPREGESK
jgi:hypothetical protein